MLRRMGFVALAALVLGAASAHAGRIASYEVDIRAQEDGSLRVHETILYDFDGGRREDIHRDLPLVLHEPPLGTRRLSLRLLGVWRDGGPMRAWYERLRNRRGEPFLRWHLGRALAGAHRYELWYRVEGAVFRVDDAHDAFIWRAPGGEWDKPVDRAQVLFQFPASWFLRAGLVRPDTRGPQPAAAQSPLIVQYFVDGHGGCGKKGVLCARRQGAGMMEANGLAPHEGVTVQGRFLRRLEWAGKLTSPQAAKAVALFLAYLAMLGIGFAALRQARTRGPAPIAAPVRYAPPEGVDAPTAWVLAGSPLEGNPLVATLLELVREGIVRLRAPKKKGAGDVPLLLLARAPSEWGRISEPRRFLLKLLFPDGVDTCNPKQVQHREGWSDQWQEFADQVVQACRLQGLIAASSFRWLPLLFFGSWFVGLWTFGTVAKLQDLVPGVAKGLLEFLGLQSGVAMFLLISLLFARLTGKKAFFVPVAAFLMLFEIAILSGFTENHGMHSLAGFLDPVLWQNPLVLLGAALTVPMGPMLAASIIGAVKSGMAARAPVSAFTRRGRRLARHLAGFRKFLVRAEKDRLDRLFAEDFEHIPPELPYAVAFGITDGWVQRLSRLLGPVEVHGGKTSIPIS